MRHLVLVRVRQGPGRLRGVRQLDVEAQRVSLAVAGGIMFPHRLVEPGSLLAAPRVAELVVAQRRLQVACKTQNPTRQRLSDQIKGRRLILNFNRNREEI